MDGRHGKSLVEVLVVVGILGTLVAILLPAVQKVRAYSLRVIDQNHQRQIVLALHQYATSYNGKLPGRYVPPAHPLADSSPLVNILPYVGSSLDGVSFRYPVVYPVVKLYLSPTDPTVARLPPNSTHGPTSYGLNQQVFGGRPSLASTFADGLSNTIALSQRYCYSNFRYDNTTKPLRTTYVYYELAVPNDPTQVSLDHSGTFADPVYFDAVPVRGAGGTRCSIPGATFQTAPTPDGANSRFLQASQAAGLLVCMFDGSVRTYSPTVSEAVFWSAVTPSGSEVAPD
jgi:type II secretory pathway pseudopilin PulG